MKPRRSLAVAPVVPKECRLVVPGAQQLSPGAVVVRGTLECPDGIAGRTIAIAGLDRHDFPSERLPEFILRYEARTGERAAICRRELDGDYRYSTFDA